MKSLNELLNKLFPYGNNNPSSYVHEPIKRSKNESDEYELWKQSSDLSEVLEYLGEAYHLKKDNIENVEYIQLLQSKYANGLAISYTPSIEQKHFQFLFDFIKEQVQNIGYKTTAADRTIVDKDHYVETTEKYFLKPPVDYQRYSEYGEKLNQMYGNILLEHIMIDNSPSYIKIQANVYSDSLYEEPLNFDDFISLILSLS